MTHLYGGIIIFVVVLLVNARFNVVPYIFFAPIVVVAGSVFLIYVFQPFEETAIEGRSQISSSEAPQAINEYLEESPGKNPINFKMNKKVHEDTQYVSVEGQKFQAYGVIGFEKKTGNPYEAEPVRVIWNLDENDLVAYDGEIPNGMNRTDPFFDKHQWSTIEGRSGDYPDADEDGEKAQNVVHVNAQGPAEGQGG